MQFNFDKLTQRRNTNCVKWDVSNDPENIPMWVADMDFEAAPCIQKALQKRVDHGIFGYTHVPDSYYEAITSWFSRRYQWQIDPKLIVYTTGVVPALSAAVRAICQPGDGVVIQTPVYNCFYSSIRNNGCRIVESPLVRVECSAECRVQSAEFTFRMDLEDLERKCADPSVKAMILCNPHNPAGRIWTREELAQVDEICRRHNVFVISDEIHCELAMPYPGHNPFTPFAKASDRSFQNSVILNSPSKSFNTAGLHVANIICPNEEVRTKIDRAINDMEICDVNPFGVVALQAAYNEGEPWLNALNQYIWENYLALLDFSHQYLPLWKICKLEGTYLAWIDITATGLTSESLVDQIAREAHVQLNTGTMYGPATGEGYIRLNLACPRARLMEALERIKQTGICSK